MRISKDPADYRYQPPPARTRRAMLAIESVVALIVCVPCAVVVLTDDDVSAWLLIPAGTYLVYRVATLAVRFRREWQGAASLNPEPDTE